MTTITTEQMQKMREREDVLILNVLAEEEFERAHIAETRNVPIGSDDFVRRVTAVATSKDMPVVVYCAGPECDASPRAAETLEGAGFTRVFDYEGGMKSWLASGHDVERAAPAIH